MSCPGWAVGFIVRRSMFLLDGWVGVSVVYMMIGIMAFFIPKCEQSGGCTP